jgi:tetratricopeptide (TPR) repeat protein
MNYEFERGMVDFKLEHYQSAIDRWEPLLTENPANDTLNYFLGTAYLELKNTEPAIARLKKVTEKPQSKFINEAHWYLALAYILENRTEDAVKILENTNHPSKAELLNKLNRK